MFISQFSRKFQTNLKSRKPLLHKAFRGFVFRRIFRNHLRLCGSRVEAVLIRSFLFSIFDIYAEPIS